MISYKKIIGYVPEESEIYPHLSGFEYLQLVGRLWGLEDKILEEKNEQLMNLFRLYGSIHFYISSYPKRMKQKVLIITAILHNPEILLLDEPLSGLDVTSVLIFKDLIKKTAASAKIILSIFFLSICLLLLVLIFFCFLFYCH
jgi:ABC-2 type transport system ATP-binding protein